MLLRIKREWYYLQYSEEFKGNDKFKSPLVCMCMFEDWSLLQMGGIRETNSPRSHLDFSKY